MKSIWQIMARPMAHRKYSRSLASEMPKIHYNSVQHPSESHALIRPFAGSSTWVFGVDGDEIYEPDRLARLRQKIFSGDFDKYWMLLGNVLHATKLADRPPHGKRPLCARRAGA